MDMRLTTPMAAQAVWHPFQAWSALLDLPRQQSTMASHAACAMFSGFEAMRGIQEKAAHQALQHHGEAVARLQGRCGPMDVLSIQLDLVRYDLEAAAAYWQQLAAAALQMQARVAACGCELIDSDKLLEACAAFETH
jgi:hypothetical protein